MEEQDQTAKYPVQGHSHDHLYRLLEKFNFPIDKLGIDQHHAHHHDQELSYCPFSGG